MFLIRCNQLLVRTKGRPAAYINLELSKGESLGILDCEESHLFFEAIMGLRPYFGAVELNGKIGFMARSLPPPFLTVSEFALLHNILPHDTLSRETLSHDILLHNEDEKKDKNSARKISRKIFTMSLIEKRMFQLKIALQGTNIAILDHPLYAFNDIAKKKALELMNEYISNGGCIIASFEKKIEFGTQAWFKNGKLSYLDEKDPLIISALNAYSNLSNFSKKHDNLFEHEEDD